MHGVISGVQALEGDEPRASGPRRPGQEVLTMKMKNERRALDKIYKRRDRYEIPEWQRDEVWPPDRKQLLIDTILRGWELPKFYFAKVPDSSGEFEVVDGQQRLMTIFEFFEGELLLSAASAKRFGGASYRLLPDSLVDAFDD